MGLLRRKDPDFIDLPGDQVAFSEKKADEMADESMERIVELYGEVVPAETEAALMGAARERYPALSGKPGSLLASAIKMGYATRLFEEGFPSTPSQVPMLTEDLQGRVDRGMAPADAMRDLALSLADYSPNDPSAPRSLDAIPGLGGLRDAIAKKCVIGTAAMARNTGWAEGDQLFPDGVEIDDVFRAWRIGFLIRSAEASLPAGVELHADESERTICVDVFALRDAVNDWLYENPSATDDEVQAKYLELATRFRVDDADIADAPDSDEARYVFFNIDQSGRIVPPSD